MSWLKNHIPEVLMLLGGLIISFEVWQTRSIHVSMTNDAVMKTEIQSINKAVNNVGSQEQTLREIVVDNQKTLNYIKGRIDSGDVANNIKEDDYDEGNNPVWNTGF